MYVDETPMSPRNVAITYGRSIRHPNRPRVFEANKTLAGNAA